MSDLEIRLIAEMRRAAYIYHIDELTRSLVADDAAVLGALESLTKRGIVQVIGAVPFYSLTAYGQAQVDRAIAELNYRARQAKDQPGKAAP